MTCDFCGDDRAQPVRFTGLVMDDKNVIERFNAQIDVCYACRIVDRVLDGFDKEGK